MIDEGLVSSLHIADITVDRIVAQEKAELERRELLYRGNRPPMDVRGRTVIIVDDGLATGSTMRAAVMAIRQLNCKDIVVAVPVCAPTTCAELKRDVDVWCVCYYAPEPFYAVGLWYRNFNQTTDEEVEQLLAEADTGGVYAKHFV